MSFSTRSIWPFLAIYLIIALALFVGCSGDNKSTQEPLPETHRPKRMLAASPERCAQCHDNQHANWLESHHANANRLLDAAIDTPAFRSPLAEGEETSNAPNVSNSSLLLPGPSPDGDQVAAIGVLAHHPLRQYLVEAHGGRLQAHSLAFDPEKKEWFDIFENDGRVSGEWGHWSNQGMNWNSNCAWCHMTEYDKNYDLADDTYHSEWTSQAVSCLQCHSQSIEHADSAERGEKYVSANPYEGADMQIAMQNCATCHSRREDLTDGDFVAGDPYHDHFRLALPDREGLYFADFKARDEDYVYASLQLSSMGHAGVTCMDCHDPHSGGFVAPRENNALCLQCHSTGKLDAPLINPTAHSRHATGSTGNSCIECHMPTRTYMARDPRHDHGFTIPDPHLTAELAIPNACSDCHDDQSIGWVTQAYDSWFTSPANDARRAHALMMADAWDLETPLPTEALITAFEGTENPYRRATYLQTMANAGAAATVLNSAADPLKSPHAILRAAAVRLLANDPNQLDRLTDMLDDPSRSVRLNAYGAVRSLVPDAAIDHSEHNEFLQANADRPQIRLQLALEASVAGDPETAFSHAKIAISFDSHNAAVYYEGAIALASGGHLDSAQILLGTATEAARNTGLIDYAQGLLWAEKGNTGKSLASLRSAVEKDPSQERWWYNLVVSHMQNGNNSAAQTVLRRALSLHPNSSALRNLQTR